MAVVSIPFVMLSRAAGAVFYTSARRPPPAVAFRDLPLARSDG